MRSYGMKFDLILAVDDGDGHVTNISLGQLARAEVSDMATLGLSLAESKQLLAELQHEVVVRQFEATTQQRRHCEQCGTKRATKDFHGARFRSLFGDSICGCRGCANVNVPWASQLQLV